MIVKEEILEDLHKGYASNIHKERRSRTCYEVYSS